LSCRGIVGEKDGLTKLVEFHDPSFQMIMTLYIISTVSPTRTSGCWMQPPTFPLGQLGSGARADEHEKMRAFTTVSLISQVVEYDGLLPHSKLPLASQRGTFRIRMQPSVKRGCQERTPVFVLHRMETVGHLKCAVVLH
jgi:hypothetical protein